MDHLIIIFVGCLVSFDIVIANRNHLRCEEVNYIKVNAAIEEKLATATETILSRIDHLESQMREFNSPINTLNICETKECVNQAAVILNALDTSVDPCDDFYKYACGGWIKNNPIPENMGGTSALTLAQIKNNNLLKSILSSDHTNDRDAIKKAKIYYKGCVDEETLNKLDAVPAFELIEQLGGFPLFGGGIEDKNFNLEKYLAKALVYDTPILHPYVNADRKNSSNHILNVEQPALLMPSREYYLNDEFSATQKVFRQFLHDLLQMLWTRLDTQKKNDPPTFDQDALKDAVNQIYELEKEIAEIMVPKKQLLNFDEVYNKMPIKKMEDVLTKDFDWSTYLEIILATADVKLTDIREVGTITVPYFTKMMPVLKKFSNSVIQNYVIVYNLVKNLDLLSKNYRDTMSDYRKATTGAADELTRWQYCLYKSFTDTRMAVGAAYVKEAFPEENRETVLKMTNLIFEYFRKVLDTVDWMDDETANAAKIKLASFVPMMAYPEYIVNDTNTRLDDEYKYAELTQSEFFQSKYSLYKNQKIHSWKKLNLPVERTEWILSPAEVNAYFDGPRRVMLFPAGIMQAPFFSSAQPFSSNFGGIGQVVAHELTHGFDKTGSVVDEKGNIRDWWSNSSRTSFKTKEQCFVEQYGKYFYETAGKYLNGELTVGENVADNAGARNAYGAYQMWKARNPNKEFSLPGLEKYTPEQMFFINFAQVTCAQETKETAIRRVTQYYHSPFPFRVLGPLQNFDKFGETFGCKMGFDKMYRKPENVCILW